MKTEYCMRHTCKECKHKCKEYLRETGGEMKKSVLREKLAQEEKEENKKEKKTKKTK